MNCSQPSHFHLSSKAAIVVVTIWWVNYITSTSYKRWHHNGAKNQLFSRSLSQMTDGIWWTMVPASRDASMGRSSSRVLPYYLLSSHARTWCSPDQHC